MSKICSDEINPLVGIPHPAHHSGIGTIVRCCRISRSCSLRVLPELKYVPSFRARRE